MNTENGLVHHADMKRPSARRAPPRPAYRLTFMRQWREDRELSLEVVAEAAGITHATLSRIERGLLPYSQEIMEKVAKALKTDVVSLLTRDPGDDAGIWPIWDRAAESEKEMIVELAKTVVKRGEGRDR